jgi:hypothetical protein
MAYKNELTLEEAKKKADDKESTKEVALLLVAVLGTLLFISAIMVRPPSHESRNLLNFSRLAQHTSPVHALT